MIFKKCYNGYLIYIYTILIKTETETLSPLIFCAIYVTNRFKQKCNSLIIETGNEML